MGLLDAKASARAGRKLVAPVRVAPAPARAWGAYGFDVDLLKGRAGRWYCLAHRPQA